MSPSAYSIPLSKAPSPIDRRFQQGGWLLLASLVMFFLSSVLLYGFYAYWRRDDPLSLVPLPMDYLFSTVMLFATSGTLHLATLAIRREKRVRTVFWIIVSLVLAIGFTGMQLTATNEMLSGPALAEGNGKGLAGMVAVLVFLHALHVAGGIIALAIVLVRTLRRKYDHECYWPIRFAAQYWHFLDLVWIVMLISFWSTTGGFVIGH
ncbi:Cytochrome bo(3) ubiquinol oxidase subunit 3 [Novipirellula aureliae]|uniref:Cytochrome bo(3) ubiquinol oxidase subunit 3 n=1 Tax=Novipirellula aureliae TaxID=2527966 RepID=A0A5C6DKU0_9BACT|nr:cytochrome c oxidase subunit 3 [Novipirellula aureliae]TWU36714.1 Cytochrome bo(3) ubiquinol oxidase subunit 3 [Novipirellula aureliae]